MQRQVHIRHDHAGAHDFYCRCRSCKPPLVGSQGHGTTMAVILAFILAIIALIAL